MDKQTKKYIYIQPEYIKQFRCDGQKCNAKCCRKWNIPIDSATYQKYLRLKPKSEAKRILESITFKREYNSHFIKHDEHGHCPLLTSECLCSIQLKHGEGFLSDTCASYPRVAHCLVDYYERSLTMTCPLAAELILLSTEPMAFEQVELDEMQHAANGTPSTFLIPREWIRQLFTIQYAAISILQSRNLSLDGRLIVLGFYFDRLDELINGNRSDEIETLSAVYSSEQFLTESAPHLVESIDFDASAYIKTMFNLLEALYGEGSKFSALDGRYLDAVSDVLDISVDKNKGASVHELAKNYMRLGSARNDFLKRNSIKLEHYLVNEFFLGLYPWKVSMSIVQNYGVFVSAYKILELVALSLEVQWKKWHAGEGEPPEEYRLPATMTNLSTNIDHNKEYVQCVMDNLNGDVLTIMRSLL